MLGFSATHYPRQRFSALVYDDARSNGTSLCEAYPATRVVRSGQQLLIGNVRQGASGVLCFGSSRELFFKVLSKNKSTFLHLPRASLGSAAHCAYSKGKDFLGGKYSQPRATNMRFDRTMEKPDFVQLARPPPARPPPLFRELTQPRAAAPKRTIRVVSWRERFLEWF